MFFLAQFLADARKRAADERAAADALLLEVANLRDAAVHSRSKSRSGRYDLWPLRHRIYLAHPYRTIPYWLGEATTKLYGSCVTGSDTVQSEGHLDGDAPGVTESVNDYQLAIDRWEHR